MAAGVEVLTNEMKRYEYSISPSGAITYSAPEGYHDDCVIALALAVSGTVADAVGLMTPFHTPETRRFARPSARIMPTT